MLDMFDRVGVKVTSHMVGAAVEKNPQLAKEIVQRGHEAEHGQTWTPQYSMTPEEERTSYEASIRTLETATGTRPLGFNAFWLRGTPHTLEILQDLGFLYHIDDISRDEPFLIPVRNKPFVVVPYTIHTNDIVNYEGRHWTTSQFGSELKYEFDQLLPSGRLYGQWSVMEFSWNNPRPFGRICLGQLLRGGISPRSGKSSREGREARTSAQSG